MRKEGKKICPRGTSTEEKIVQLLPPVVICNGIPKQEHRQTIEATQLQVAPPVANAATYVTVQSIL